MTVVKIIELIVVDGKIFRVNQEYNLNRIITKSEYCGCSGTGYKDVDYYEVIIDNTAYLVHNNNAVILNRPLGAEDVLSPEEYHSTLRGVAKADNRNYDDIRSQPDINKIIDSTNNIPM